MRDTDINKRTVHWIFRVLDQILQLAGASGGTPHTRQTKLLCHSAELLTAAAVTSVRALRRTAANDGDSLTGTQSMPHVKITRSSAAQPTSHHVTTRPSSDANCLLLL
jgi:hypothetical protein